MRLPGLLLLLPLALAGCVTSGKPDATPGNLPDALQGLAHKHRVCAVTVAVIKNRQLDAVHSATACQLAATLHPDSVFQAASLAKPVFAYAVLQLVAQGKMALDAPVVQYLPQGYRHRPDRSPVAPAALVTDPRLQAVTVRMVLNHTSGLPNWAFGTLGFDAAPGTRWGYSGEGYLLLQRAVEAVAGVPLDQFMVAQVFAPLGMHHSSYVWNEGIAQHLVAGTKANGKPRTTPHLTRPNAAYSLYTTAPDYAKFVVRVLGDDATLRQISASPAMVDAKLGQRWGLGWGLEAKQDDAYIWHWGNNMGYRAFVIASLRTGDALVMLTNSENGLTLAEPLSQQVLPGQLGLFQSPVLGVDIINVLCNTVRVCL